MKRTTNKMTRAEFEAVPDRKWGEDIGLFDSLVILPLRGLHDSGYRRLDFVACRANQAVKRLSGCSDVLHLGGIGGYGKWETQLSKTVLPVAWSVDCLAKSGLLRIFTHDKLTCGQALSSFEVWAERKTP